MFSESQNQNYEQCTNQCIQRPRKMHRHFIPWRNIAIVVIKITALYKWK